jgi:hypothetical protein
MLGKRQKRNDQVPDRLAEPLRRSAEWEPQPHPCHQVWHGLGQERVADRLPIGPAHGPKPDVQPDAVVVLPGLRCRRASWLGLIQLVRPVATQPQKIAVGSRSISLSRSAMRAVGGARW